MATARDFMIRQAAMYQAYHRDHRNVLTHVVGVPMIMFAILLLLHRAHLGWIAPSYFPALTLGWIAFLVFFVGGWIIQLVGHSIFEGRRPALTDNILQVFVAPIFLVLEALYRAGSHHDLRDEIERLSHAHDERPVEAG